MLFSWARATPYQRLCDLFSGPLTLVFTLLDCPVFARFLLCTSLLPFCPSSRPLPLIPSLLHHFLLFLVPSFTPSCPLLEELKEKHPDWPWSTLLPHTPLSNTDYAFIAIESGRCALVSSVYHTTSLPTLLSTSSYTLSFYLLSICHIVSLISIKQSFICFAAITLSHLWTAHYCLLFLILHRHSLSSSLPFSPCL